MSSTLIGFTTLACILAGYALGLVLKWRLPEHHVGGDSRDTIKQTISVLGSIAGICLGLMVASAKNTYDAKVEALNRIAADVIILDRGLARYGSEAAELRAMLRTAVEGQRRLLWHDGKLMAGPTGSPGAIESFQDALRGLHPATEERRAIHADAAAIGNRLAATRWEVYVRGGSTIPPTFLVVLVFWQFAMFAGLGLVASRNLTNGVAIIVGAVSVAAAIFLILELETPYHGLISISDAPLRLALEQLGR
jgi:hypothetical protein